jgi:cytochrome b subunit of formate dehydrogenase
MIAASLYHVFYISFTVRGRKFVKDMWIRKQDALDAFHSILFLAGTSKTKPRFGRFSYIEKMEYWAVVWGTVIMGLTGGVLWFENTFMSLIRPEGMYIATTIHYYEAILASLAILVWHFYFVFMNPDIKGMNKAWITGHLTREEMMHEHPLELEELDKSAAEINDAPDTENEKTITPEEKITEKEKVILSEAEEKDVPAIDAVNNTDGN